jgi:hypothetical protein
MKVRGEKILPQKKVREEEKVRVEGEEGEEGEEREEKGGKSRRREDKRYL